MANTITEKVGARHIVILFLMFVSFIACMGFNTTSTAILLPQWTAEMGFSPTQYGLLAGCLAMGQVWTVFLAGMLLDKVNPKILLGCAVILNGIFMCARGWISNFATAYIILFISGITGAFINPGVLKIVNTWFNSKWIYRCNGILYSGGAIGYFIGLNGTIPWATSLGGWDKVFLVFGIVIAVVGIAMLIFIPTRKESEGAMNKEMNIDTESYTFGRKLKECFKSKQILMCVISEFFIAGSILSFTSVGPLAFTTINEGMTTAEAGLAISMSNVGSVFSYWILPIIISNTGWRKRFIIPCIIWGTTLYILSPYAAGVSIALSGAFICAAGAANGCTLIGGRTLMMEHRDTAGVKAGTAAGLLVELNKIGCVVCPLVLTTIFTATGNMHIAYITMIGMAYIGIIFIALAEDTGKKAQAKRAAKLAAKAAAQQ